MSKAAVKPAFDTGIAIAHLLVQEGLISADQVKHAVRVQSKLAQDKSLLNTMLDLEYFNRQQFSEILRRSSLNIRLGDLLVELGDITATELSAAIRMQREQSDGKKLGEILIEQRFIKEQRLIDVLANQLGYPRVEPEFGSLDQQLLGKVTAEWCEKHQVVPVRMEDDKAVVACIDPKNEVVKELAERQLGKPVLLAISSQHAIQGTINKIRNRSAPAKSEVEDSRIVRMVAAILEDAAKLEASDIHLEPSQNSLRIRFRRDGVMWLYKELASEDMAPVMARLKVMSNANIAEKRRHQDGKLEFTDPISGYIVDVRCSFYVSVHGEKCCMRLLNRKATLLDIQEIGMAPSVLERFKYEALDVPTGVTLITGPTGSGKTTTLYGCVAYLNNDETSIITAEEPVEYVIEGITQCSLNPKIDMTFAETLRHMVRQDPDVIVLGEIRDKESAESAIQAALTGHKVLTTFHTEDTIGGLLRLMNMNIETFLISSTVVSVLAQRLLRRVCPHCAQPHQPSPLEMQRVGLQMDDLRIAEFKVGAGCEACHYSGYNGRVCVFELLVLDERVKDAILNNKASYDIRRISIESSGLITLLEDGLEKASRGHTSLSEVLRTLPRLDKPRPLNDIRRLCRNELG